MFDLSTDLETFVFDDRDCYCLREYRILIGIVKFNLFEPLVVEFGIKPQSLDNNFEVKWNSSWINDEINVKSGEENRHRAAVHSTDLTHGQLMTVRPRLDRSFSKFSEVFHYDLCDVSITRWRISR